MGTVSSDAAGRRLPRLHLVTDDAVLATSGFLEAAEAALGAGGPEVALHLRGPRTDGLHLFRLGERLAAEVGRSGSLLLVNDRVDVALAVGAHGVQLGARGLEPADARRMLGPERWVGASVHSVAAAAACDEADFLVAGTLFSSASHPGRPPAGTGWLRSLQSAGQPVIGIGGIGPEQVPAVRAAGAWGVAVVNGVWRSPDPCRAIRRYLEALGDERTV